MRQIAMPSFVAAAALLAFATVQSGCGADEPSETARLAGYAVGYSTAHRLGGVGALPPDAFARGLRDGLAGGDAGAATMDRPEFVERMRHVFFKVAEADLNAQAEMVD